MGHWVVIYAIGAAQAMLLALALWRRRANRHADRILAAWLASVGADLAIKALYMAEPVVWLFKPARLVTLLPFLYASLFYLYVRALTMGLGVRLRDLVHGAGFAFALAWTTPLFLLGAEDTALRFARAQSGHATWLPTWFDPLLYGYAFAYIAAALRLVRRYHRALRAGHSAGARQSLGWITMIAIGQLVIWTIAAVQSAAPVPWIDYDLIYAAVAAWVCVVGYSSLAQSPPGVLEQAAPAAGGDEQPAREDDPRFDEVQARLSRLMRDRQLYREPALTIGQLAKCSGYPEYLVSAVINRRFGGTFWDYINRQRIDAARAALADQEDARTIIDIAYGCGFTSKSTFNAAFKRRLGLTPSAYRRSCAERPGARPSAGAGSARPPQG
ncbi:helix-turn-helix domain-containing protein [Coralloluteibacterium stylophorae]|uniref:Helix-turn-helix transcriptional regulator n=1 Tax=Coralloluteibacterium stylophorae TaxID=1776034 RepID=A0A8J8AW02_9GAMM|nr:helix-turn-helix transcriptional regulator [Coralloluteibacterium stylophorae]MBS7456867.1 helix-turn-helix transcriptional regulator [Coralloluteibacterium stylophorae]